jgi:ribosome-associated protein
LDIKTLQSVIVDALDDIKARDIVVFDTTKGTAEFDRVIIATAEVARQTKAMAMNVIEKVKQAGGRIVAMEGGDTGEWVLVDCSDVVVHIMQPAVRQYYNLEELWGQKKVAVLTAAEKAAAAKAAAVKAAAAKKKSAAKAKPAAAKPGKKAVKKVLQRTRKKVVSVKKPAAPKGISKKAAPKKSAVVKAPARQSTIKKAKKAPLKKTAQAPAKRAAAKAPARKKPLAKK